MRQLPLSDILVLVVSLIGTVGLGCCFVVRSRRPEAFMTAGRSMPAWLVGLSVFGAYMSSVSFLALPTEAFMDNWTPFAFSLSIPLAAWIGTRWFVPFYRSSGEISAYAHLERRFGVWARMYAVVGYLLTQAARMGAVMLLLALPLHQLLGWDLKAIILVTGGLTTLYTLLGGIEGVIWTAAVQGVILIVGVLLCAILLPLGMPDESVSLFEIAYRFGKLDFDGFRQSPFTAAFWTGPTVWVVFVYGLVVNLQNFGIDQNYVQRYHTAKSEADATRSLWIGAILYLPVSALLLFIGAALFAYYVVQPELLPRELWREFGEGRGDNVFPYFVVTQFPAGMAGLVIAAIFAAAMSTLSASLNGSATLTLIDVYKRLLRPQAGERESMAVLYGASLFWGIVGTGTALAMLSVRSALDAWWELASVFAGGMLGLFLLGMIARHAKRPAAATGVILGILIMAWMTISPRWNDWFPNWGELPSGLQNPLHNFLTIVVGTLTILLVGLLASRWPSSWGKTDRR